MIFQKRIDRNTALMQERQEARKSGSEARQDAMPLEKGDMPAMIASALLVLVPVALVALLVVVGLAAWWIL